MEVSPFLLVAISAILAILVAEVAIKYRRRR